MNKRIILAGGSGFLGQSLAHFLQSRGYSVTILTRGRTKEENNIRFVQWDGANLGDWAKEIEGCYAVINFTGKSVDCIYTKKNKEEIISSRLNSVRVLHEAIIATNKPPQVFVQAGSLAIFGNTEQVCDEDAKHGEGFSVSVCEQWEDAFFKVKLPQTRQVMLRIGFALGRDGGALGPLKNLAKFNLGGTIGSGKQYISWLHIDDLNEMFLASIEDESIVGTYNATGPTPVRNKEFMQALRKSIGKKWAPPAPTPLVWIGAYTVMGAEPELALTGRNCIPKRLLDHGFSFKYTDLEEALIDLL